MHSKCMDKGRRDGGENMQNFVVLWILFRLWQRSSRRLQFILVFAHSDLPNTIMKLWSHGSCTVYIHVCVESDLPSDIVVVDYRRNALLIICPPHLMFSFVVNCVVMCRMHSCPHAKRRRYPHLPAVALRQTLPTRGHIGQRLFIHRHFTQFYTLALSYTYRLDAGECRNRSAKVSCIWAQQ